MDCVYICRAGENEELRYSIRSIVDNLPHDKIWVVGSKPSWYTGNFIPVKDTADKFTNISNALKIAAEHPEISDDFILMNDDFFLIKPVDILPTMHGGKLSDKIAAYASILPNSKYVNILCKAERYLARRGIKESLDYDIHVPMVMNKQKLIDIAGKTLAPRSVYGNLNNVGGEMITDVKTYSSINPLSSRSYDFKANDNTFLSCEDKSFAILYKQILKKMFSKKTVYEK